MLVYIKPLSLFPNLHSDTLFGALTSAIQELFPEKLDLMLDDFLNNNPPFLISSAFPYIFSDNEKIKFFPKIMMNSEDKVNNIEFLKKYKDVDYLEESIFFDLLNGKISEKDIINNFKNYTQIDNLLMTKNYGINVDFKRNIVPNNSVNRLTNETNSIFYSEGMQYSNMGVFFYIELINNDYGKIILSALKFLSDRGFGRDISTGKGQFDYEVVNENIIRQSGNRFITLSRFIPSDDELDLINSQSCYEISSKRGRDKSGEIRKQIRFFKEGSTFNNFTNIPGQVLNSGTNFPAIEYGFAFPIMYGGE